MARAYLLAIEGCTLPALQSAIRLFIRGEVEDHSGKFAPTTAELARAVRYEDYRIDTAAQYAARMLAKPQPEPEPEFTEEEMERRRAQVDALLGRTKMQKIPTRDAA